MNHTEEIHEIQVNIENGNIYFKQDWTCGDAAETVVGKIALLNGQHAK